MPVRLDVTAVTDIIIGTPSTTHNFKNLQKIESGEEDTVLKLSC